MRRLLGMLKQAAIDFFADDAMTLAGALAFYTALSMAPLLILLLSGASLLGNSTQDSLTREIESMVGPQAGEGVALIIENADRQANLASVAGVVGVLTLLFSATSVFAQLQHSLNRIWEVQVKPGGGVWGWIRKRILSLGMLLAIAFILLVSLAMSTVLGMILPHTGVIWQAVSVGVSMLVFTALFALMFKYLPDVRITWRSVWAGAALTAVLFALGKFLISLYLAHSSVASSYGAAGSLIVLLLWVYYSALIVFFGAELTQVYAHAMGVAIQPSSHAEPVREVEAESGRPAPRTT